MSALKFTAALALSLAFVSGGCLLEQESTDEADYVVEQDLDVTATAERVLPGAPHELEMRVGEPDPEPWCPPDSGHGVIVVAPTPGPGTPGHGTPGAEGNDGNNGGESRD